MASPCFFRYSDFCLRLFGIPSPTPFWMRRGAEIQADQGSRCLSEASLARPRLNRAPQVAPERSAGDAATRVAFLLGTFLWRSKEKCLARRGETRLRDPNNLSAKTHKEPSIPQAERVCDGKRASRRKPRHS